MAFRSGNTTYLPGGRTVRVRRHRPKVRKAPPTGPYRAESSVRSIREKATPAERRSVSRGKSRTATRVRRLEEKDRREAAKAKRDAAEASRAVKRAAASRPVQTLRRAESKLSKHPDPQLRESARRLRHALASEALYKASQSTPEGSPVKENFPERELKSVAPRAYGKAIRAAQAGGHGSSRGLGEPEDLTTAITVVAPGAGFVGALGKRAVQQGGKKVVQEVAEAAAGKVESGATRALKAGSNVKAAGRAARNVGRRARRKPPVRRARKPPRESRYAQIALPGAKLGKVGGSQAFPVVRGHEQALIDNPKKTLKTTARALPGLVTAPVGAAVDVGVTGGRAASAAAHELGIPGARGYSGKEILAPIKGMAKEQVAFARQVAKVVTASDTEEVKREVEDNLGLMLPIMLGLSGAAVGKKISKGRVTEAVRRVAERARERHGSQHGYRGGKAPRVLETTGQRKEAAKSAAKGRTRLQAELSDRQRGMVEAARGATREEVVRKGVVRKRGGRKGDLKIRDADVASFLQRHPMKLDDPVAMLAEVRRIEARLKPTPKGMKPSPDKLYTRDVIDYIKRRPDVLANPAVIRVVREYRAQGGLARRRKDTLAPEHSERARFLTAATTRDIPFPEEMFPRSIRGTVRATPERGRLAKDVLRREARRDRSRARTLKRKAATAEKKAAIMRRELKVREKGNKTNLELGLADWQVRELKTVKELERRGMIPPDAAPVGGHLRVVTPREGRVTAKTLPKGHEALRERIDKLDVRAATLREKAIEAETMAGAKHKASHEVDTSLTPEFAGIVQQRLRQEGITEDPEYQYAGPGRDHGAPVYGSSGTKLAQFPGKSKRRKGVAEEFGMVEEGLRPMVRESIARPVARRESYKAAREVIEDNRFEPGGKREWNAHDADELFAGPDPVLSPQQWMKVPRQFYKRIYDVLEGKGKGKGITAHDLELVGGLDAVRKGEVKGSHYMIVRRAAMDELVSQLSNTLIAPKLANANRATSYLILGTSPAWAAMQVVAEYSQAAVAQPRLLNPAFVRKATEAYKAMDPEKRQAFDSWVGVTTRTIERPEDLKLDLKAGDMHAAADAYGTLNATPYGRFLKGIPTAIKRVDQWKGGRIRTLATLAKIDKDLNGRANHFIHGVGGLHREMGTALKEMKGKSLKEQAEWVAEHPKWARRYQGYLDDVLGNWSALTKNERVAAQAMIFYPFVRMSLRWTFYAFPKRHPVKAATLYYLGQQNANEVKKLLGGNPSYFTQWAMVPLDLGDGNKKFVDLSRIAPGSNALVEALGGSTEGPKGIAAAKLAQPVLAALGTAVYGVSPLSGEQEKGSGWNALAQLLSLSPLSRTAGELTLPAGRKKGEGVGQLPVIGSLSTERQEALDKLSAKLRQYDTAARYARTLAIPPLPKDAGKEADSALLGRVLKAFEKNSSSARDDLSAEYATRMKNAVEEGKRGKLRGMKKERDKRLVAMEAEYDEADRVLDHLFDKHGIEHEKEDRLFLEFYGEGKYGTGGDSSNPWSGSSGGESNPWAESSGEESNPWSGK